MIIQGDSREVLKTFPDNHFHAIITDPPYFLLNDSGKGFMGKEWESLNRKKSIDIICKSKEFAHFVVRIFTLLRVESNTVEESSVQENANTKDKNKSTLSQPSARFAEKRLNGNLPTSKANTNSVRGIVLTKDALLGLLKELSQRPINASENLPENALFAVPSLFIENLLRKHALKSANTLKLKQADDAEAPEILLTSMEDQRIKNVIAAMSGKICEERSIGAIDIPVNCAGNTVEGVKYRLITSEDIKNPLITQWIIWLLYAIDVMQRSITTGKSSTDFLNTDLVYQFHKQWAEAAFRVLRPGGHLLAFGGTRSYHTMARAIEDAGFVCRDFLEWVYGSGFPKSLNIEKQLSQEDAEKWKGFGTALKPAHEPIGLFRKPLAGRVIDNIRTWGCGGINVDGCRISTNGEKILAGHSAKTPQDGWDRPWRTDQDLLDAWRKRKDANAEKATDLGRFPSNLILSHSPNCVKVCRKKIKGAGWKQEHGGLGQESVWKGTKNNERGPSYTDATGHEEIDDYVCSEDCPIRLMGEQSGICKSGGGNKAHQNPGMWKGLGTHDYICDPSSGSAARYFLNIDPDEGSCGPIQYDPFYYCSKASPTERQGCKHPTIKPLKLIKYLVALICPPGGLVLDPFLGSGTTGLACNELGFEWVGIDLDTSFAEQRIVKPQKTLMEVTC